MLTTLGTLPESSVPPSALRDALIPLIHTYPHSTYLTCQLHALRTRTHQLSLLRLDFALLAASVGTSAAIPFALAAVAALEGKVGGQHAVRASFEAALQGCPPLELAMRLAEGRAGGAVAVDTVGVEEGWEAAPLVAAGQPMELAPVLWLAYVQWLVAIGAMADAHSALLRAVTACPWSKGMWLRGVHLLAEQVAGTEVAQLLDVMQQRGLRLETLPAEVLLERLGGW